MRRDARAYLRDILDTAEILAGIVCERTLADMQADWGFRMAVERAMQNIGEAVFQLRRLDASLVQDIVEHERIIGLRHVLVHAYHEVKPAVLWNIIDMRLPALVEDVRRILDRLGDD